MQLSDEFLHTLKELFIIKNFEGYDIISCYHHAQDINLRWHLEDYFISNFNNFIDLISLNNKEYNKDIHEWTQYFAQRLNIKNVDYMKKHHISDVDKLIKTLYDEAIRYYKLQAFI